MISSNQKTEKKLRIRLLVTLSLWAVVGFVVIALLGTVAAETDNAVIVWLGSRLDLLYIMLLVIGFFGIFYFYWKKPWNYLNEVIDATETVYEKSAKSITLSAPLHEVESRMNQIKLSVLTSEKSVAQAEEKKNELVMYLAHDIRTPLTTVIGYLSLLDEAPDMPSEQRKKYIKIALNKSERLDVLINELFDLTRYNSKAVSLHKTEVDLSCLLSQITDEFYPALSANRNTVNVSAEDGLTLSADTEMLARVFGNLLKNAVSYSDAGTEIIISAKKENSFAVVTFQNTGETISPENLQMIFDKFSRLDQARTSETGGTGLGLSVAKEIIELHDGMITAQSKDRTITFLVRLPLAH
ncbi:MAG: HAMP domain-containing sensor histidine kinase [Bacillota bacterium]|nr:HAMP domain-containing sensor histidine kinase [Bacillota bacterium]